MRLYLKLFVVIATVLVLSVPAFADPIIFSTPTGAMSSGGPVDAQASFSIAGGDLTIILSNLLVNPTDVAQNISDIFFTLSTGNAGASIASSSGKERTVAAGGTFTDGSLVGTGWVLESDGTDTLHLNGLGTAANVPAHTIIGAPDGSGIYANANHSIAGNGPHNPFLAGDVTFVISGLNLSADTKITGVIFSFGTTPGDNVTVPPPQRVPEPTSLLLLGMGLTGVAVWNRKK